jgi:sodium transport system permease protein
MHETADRKAAGPQLPALAGAMGRIGRLIRKELTEILRDRRTILTLFLMPVLLYPLLSVAFRQFFLASGVVPEAVPAYRLGFETNEEAAVVLPELVQGHEVLRGEAKKGEGSSARWQLGQPRIGPALENALQGNVIDVGVRVPGAKAVLRKGPRNGLASCLLLYRQSSVESRQALEYVERLLAAAQRGYLQVQLSGSGAMPGVVVLRPALVPVQDAEGAGLFSLAPLVPLILILMTITGAVYPAIDLTAGERERGTLEILVAAPVPRLGLLFAKYVCVLTIAVLTALVNLVSMFVTISLSGLGPLLFHGGGPTPLLALELFGLLLLFAAFFSAVLLTLTSFARSFKEAQAYLIPLMLASLGPGLVGLLPGMQLTGLWTAVPLVNIVLLARDLLAGTAEATAAAVVVTSTVLYALAAIAMAARVFGAEGVLYSEQGTWADLLRRPTRRGVVPTVAGALLCLALIFPAQFVVQGLFARAAGPVPSSADLILSLVVMVLTSAVLFAGLPITVALWRRLPLSSSLLLRPAPWPAYLAGLLLGLSLWPFALEMIAQMNALGLTTLDLEKNRHLLEPLRLLRALLPPWVLVVTMAFVPAVTEELFFRGYLFSALRARGGAGLAVGVSALLFGLYHLVVTDLFALERLLPSTLLGLVLGWVCWRSGSVVPSMVLHACHNGALVFLSYYANLVPAAGTIRTQSLDVRLLAGAAGVVALGLIFLWRTRGSAAHQAPELLTELEEVEAQPGSPAAENVT